MTKYITSSTCVSRWLESFESYEFPENFKFSCLIEKNDFHKLTIKQKINYLEKRNVTFLNTFRGRILSFDISENLSDVICRDVFSIISFDYENGDHCYDEIEARINGLDKKNQLKIINKKVKKANKRNVKLNEYLFSKRIYSSYEFNDDNMGNFHLSFWNDNTPFSLKYKLVKEIILFKKNEDYSSIEFAERFAEYCEEGGTRAILESYKYYNVYFEFITNLIKIKYLEKIKLLVEEGAYKTDYECYNEGEDCCEEKELSNNSEPVWAENTEPYIFSSDYSINLFIYILNQYKLEKTPSFFSYLFDFFNKNLDDTYKELFVTTKPKNYIDFVNEVLDAKIGGKIFTGTEKKREEYYLIFNENEKKFKAIFASGPL